MSTPIVDQTYSKDYEWRTHLAAVEFEILGLSS